MPNPTPAKARLSPWGNTSQRLAGRPVPCRALWELPQCSKPIKTGNSRAHADKADGASAHAVSSHKPAGAPAARAPYEAIPLHEITCVVYAAPTRPCAVVRTFVPPAGDWNDRQRCDIDSASRMLFMTAN